jgi:hypothetical protein
MPRIRLFLLSLALLASVAHATVIGRIEAKGGNVERTGADGRLRTSAVFAHIEAGDVFVTGRDGWVVLSMTDSASLTLKANTRMRIGDYSFAQDKPSESRVVLDLLAGSLRSITGWIGHRNPEAYKVVTPTMTMGIRGTDHEILVAEENNVDGLSAGSYDHVYIEITSGETAFTASSARMPSKLDKQPTAYDKLQKFESDHGIDKVLNKLHRKTGQGYALNPSAATTEATDKASTSDSADKSAQAASKNEGNSTTDDKKADSSTSDAKPSSADGKSKAGDSSITAADTSRQDAKGSSDDSSSKASSTDGATKDNDDKSTAKDDGKSNTKSDADVKGDASKSDNKSTDTSKSTDKPAAVPKKRKG